MEAREKDAPHKRMKTRVFVVDDHPLLRQGIAQLINNEHDMEVCGEAENAAGALQLINIANPDIAVLDISLKGDSGIDLLKQLRDSHPEVKVLILSMHDESIFARRAFVAGASGYLTKDEATDKALLAIRCVRDGGVYVSEELAACLKHRPFPESAASFSSHHVASGKILIAGNTHYCAFAPATDLHPA